MSEQALPHSRACGIRKHDHGLSCHRNCPTCEGQATFRTSVRDSEAFRADCDKLAEVMLNPPRPQPHTFVGERGDTAVSVKLRDVYFAVLEGLRLASGADSIDQINLEGVDEIAIAQNTCVAIEQVVGIYPNIRKDT